MEKGEDCGVTKKERTCCCREAATVNMGMGFVGVGVGAPAGAKLNKGAVVCERKSYSRQRRTTVVAVEASTVAAVGTAMAGTFMGVGLLVWTEQQGARSEARVNTQVCVECKGEKTVTCKICEGTGLDPVFKSEDEPCQYCDGNGFNTCTNCNGSGIQPRFLDRVSADDFMD